VVPVDDIPGDTKILSGLAYRASFELRIHCDGGMGYVPALFDNDLLRVVDVEYILHKLLRIL
jgi:hypothetical protein